MKFERFDSIDGLCRKRLFHTPEDEDWAHIEIEYNHAFLIRDFPHAMRKRAQIGKGDIVGLKLHDHETHQTGFLGFDIIDGYFSISLLTNWGNDLEFINHSLAENALVRDFETVQRILQILKADWGDDGHVEGCQIISIYRVSVDQGEDAPFHS